VLSSRGIVSRHRLPPAPWESPRQVSGPANRPQVGVPANGRRGLAQRPCSIHCAACPSASTPDGHVVSFVRDDDRSLPRVSEVVSANAVASVGRARRAPTDAHGHVGWV